MIRAIHLLFIAAFFLSGVAQAASSRVEAKFGPEWTFSIYVDGDEFEPNQDLSDIYDSLIRQRRGTYRLVDSQFLQSPRGWKVRFGTDPGVYEVQTSPMTAREFEKSQKVIQRDVFDKIKETYGATPLLFVGGGHINIGIKEFLKNPKLLRNFIVDFYNHNELSLGIFGYDTNNALSFSLMPKTYREQVLKELNWFAKEAEFSRNNQDETLDLMDELFMNLSDEQEGVQDAFFMSWNYGYEDAQARWPHLERGKFVDLNFLGAEYLSTHLLDNARLELRAVRPQASADVYKRQIRLLQGRLDFLAKQGRDVTYKPRVKLQRVSVTKHKLNPPVNPQDALQAFYIYVTEAGEKWSDHRDYIWPMWISSGELQKFENSDWFQQQERTDADVCRRLIR